MFECLATERLLEAMIALGASLHHPLEDEARLALRAYAAADTFERRARITRAVLPALRHIAARVQRRATPRPPPSLRQARQDAL